MEGSSQASQMPSESTVKRFKYLWRASIFFTFALGAYMFAQPHKRERTKGKSEAPAVAAPTPAAVTAPPQEEPTISLPITSPVIVRQPIPEDQQRELFKWMLEEKRKTEPQNREEKRRIAADKAVLKEFIRSDSIPSV